MALEAVGKTCFVLTKVMTLGQISGPALAREPGWDASQACRYLNKLHEEQFLDKTSLGKAAQYIAGRKLKQYQEQFQEKGEPSQV